MSPRSGPGSDCARSSLDARPRTYCSNAGLRGAHIGVSDVWAAAGRATNRARPTTTNAPTAPARNSRANIAQFMAAPKCSVAPICQTVKAKTAKTGRLTCRQDKSEKNHKCLLTRRFGGCYYTCRVLDSGIVKRPRSIAMRWHSRHLPAQARPATAADLHVLPQSHSLGRACTRTVWVRLIGVRHDRPTNNVRLLQLWMWALRRAEVRRHRSPLSQRDTSR